MHLNTALAKGLSVSLRSVITELDRLIGEKDALSALGITFT
nr:MAG TPA: hypothetical protein [Caudoviricetes sp.]